MIESETQFRSATPELELIFAVVKLAVDDLESNDEQVRFEANEFFLQPRGGWANMRRYYFSLLGLNEERVVEALRDRLDPPERPERKPKTWTMMDVYEVLPEGDFKAKDIADIVGMRYSQMTGRFQHLMRMGLIMRVDRGVFVRADCYDAWHEAQLQELCPKEPEPPKSLMDALRDGPKTIREIGFAMDGLLAVDGITRRLEKAEASGLVNKQGPLWSLAA